MWEGREVEDGRRWQSDRNTVCTCTSGKVTCQPDTRGKIDSPSASFFSLSVHFCSTNKIKERTIKFSVLTIKCVSNLSLNRQLHEAFAKLKD